MNVFSFQKLKKFGEAVRWPSDKGVEPTNGHPRFMSFFVHFFSWIFSRN